MTLLCCVFFFIFIILNTKVPLMFPVKFITSYVYGSGEKVDLMVLLF